MKSKYKEIEDYSFKQGFNKALDEVEKIIIHWHSLGNNKWDDRIIDSYKSFDNAVQDLLLQLKEMREK